MTGLSLALSLIALDVADGSRAPEPRARSDDPPPLDAAAWAAQFAKWRRWAADGVSIGAGKDAGHAIEVGVPATSGA